MYQTSFYKKSPNDPWHGCKSPSRRYFGALVLSIPKAVVKLRAYCQPGRTAPATKTCNARPPPGESRISATVAHQPAPKCTFVDISCRCGEISLCACEVISIMSRIIFPLRLLKQRLCSLSRRGSSTNHRPFLSCRLVPPLPLSLLLLLVLLTFSKAVLASDSFYPRQRLYSQMPKR